MRIFVSPLVLLVAVACGPQRGGASSPDDGAAVGSPAPVADDAPAADDQPPPLPTRVEPLGELAMNVPESWVRAEPRNAMRLAEFRLPSEGGEIELLVFRFPGGAGSAQSNLDRWRGQFEGAQDVPATRSTQGPLTITQIDLSGTLVIRMPNAQIQREPDQRLLAAVVEGSGTPFYFKLMGPSAAVTSWAGAYANALSTLRVVDAPAP